MLNTCQLEEYLQDVLVRLAHHSSAIEGNTITLPDTVSIILHNTLPGGYSRREFFEIENHRDAFAYVIEQLQDKQPLNLTVLKDIHEKLMDRLLVDKGQFKTSENAIQGADFLTASPKETPFLMQQWVDNLNYQLESVSKDRDILRVIMDFHIQFERIHPFSDGNGRTGRMLMNYALIQHDLPPLIIQAKDKAAYVNYLAKQDIDGITKFSYELICDETRRMQRFNNKEKVQMKERHDEYER
ncbi:Fic family protein [Halolactibacillus sp. JCM 19043]|uniref:Fic family protein n=1 Tax=Halolactibacillus sp. JCM 19043 TaxID=1460638 RepID=UPI0007858C0F|nr:Fic family protein [Halolactibacillus sp. JCM 19043]